MELSMALVQMKGLKCRIDDILNITTYDEYADTGHFLWALSRVAYAEKT